MRYELSDYEWTAIKPMLPNKPRGVPRVNDRRVLSLKVPDIDTLFPPTPNRQRRDRLAAVPPEFARSIMLSGTRAGRR
jgi:hypothetical protein